MAAIGLISEKSFGTFIGLYMILATVCWTPISFDFANEKLHWEREEKKKSKKYKSGKKKKKKLLHFEFNWVIMDSWIYGSKTSTRLNNACNYGIDLMHYL